MKLKNSWKIIEKTFEENRFLWKPFMALLLMYIVGISAILLAGVHYADDIARTNHGYDGWNGFSRYLSTIISHGLHADNYLTNIAPLPQLIAGGLLALASLIVLCLICGKSLFREKISKWWWAVVAVLPFGLSPYMLECLSYQYDAPYMALSLLAAVLPFCFRKQSRWLYGFAILCGTLTICMTYQAAVGVIPMIAVLIAMIEWGRRGIKDKKVWKFLFFTAVVFLLSVVFFDKALMKPRDAYASNSLPELNNLFSLFFEHLKMYFELLWSDFKILWKVLIGLVMVSFIILYTYRAKYNKWLALLVACIGVGFIGVMSFAFYAVLEKPLYATRAMYPVGVFLAVMMVYVVTAKRKMFVMRGPVVVLAWCFFVFAFTYGNALREQDIYRNEIIDMVISDLNEMPEMMNDDMKVVQVEGSLGFAPAVLHMPQDYKILDRLLMPTYSEYVPWMANRVTYQSGFWNLAVDETVNLNEKNLPVLKKTVFYDILGDKNNILVVFKDKRKFNVTF